MSEAAKAEGTKKSFFKNVKAEFKKVTWPKKDDLVKQTILVVAVSVVLGAVIKAIDVVIQSGMLKFLGIE